MTILLLGNNLYFLTLLSVICGKCIWTCWHQCNNLLGESEIVCLLRDDVAERAQKISALRSLQSMSVQCRSLFFVFSWKSRNYVNTNKTPDEVFLLVVYYVKVTCLFYFASVFMSFLLGNGESFPADCVSSSAGIPEETRRRRWDFRARAVPVTVMG